MWLFQARRTTLYKSSQSLLNGPAVLYSAEGVSPVQLICSADDGFIASKQEVEPCTTTVANPGDASGRRCGRSRDKNTDPDSSNHVIAFGQEKDCPERYLPGRLGNVIFGHLGKVVLKDRFQASQGDVTCS